MGTFEENVKRLPLLKGDSLLDRERGKEGGRERERAREGGVAARKGGVAAKHSFALFLIFLLAYM